MQLIELFKQIKEDKLSKEQIEAYSDQLAHLSAEMTLEIAKLEKEEAIFMGQMNPDISVASRKIQWKATQSGLRLIELKRYVTATKDIINSCKSRVYRLIY